MIRAVLEALALLLLLGACAFGAAGRIGWPMGWTLLGAYSVFIVASFACVDPELIQERAAPGPGVDHRDAALASLGFLGLYPLTFAVAGLDAVRFGPLVTIPSGAQATAFGVFVLGYAFAFWAVRSNPFFATFVRIQDDRGHFVVDSGPYARVRHPGYAGVLVAHLALPLALGSIGALLPAIVGALLFVARTAREDRTLRERLPGYREYRERVPWRLLPGVW